MKDLKEFLPKYKFFIISARMTKDLTVLEMCPLSSVLIYRDVRRSTVRVTVSVSLVSVNVKDTGQEVNVIS